ncbi:MAG: hypothetical protein DMG04_26475 [Acidobacteria bacterium]|nr:MAG: hypothetical protein DMG04_26475 [Acidobacteriota bacterium]PYQ89953.1 MAG: hypothetical protein DMG02_11680 [Acidobacteriota bacterium]PYR08936.1 MAG: hypothetical protein DMF99_17200 [Acidobacteriota bacterium]
MDTDRRERAVFCALAVALVLLRGFVATSYEGFFFDSDQAIVGLMARRLSSFREFPLFYYGLNYLLAVEAWIIAPFFWIARSSVTVMRLPFVALNAITAVSLVTALTGSLRLRPALAFVAALPFVIPTPAAANHLLELAGACVEPFVYVLILWKLRRRPLAFGAVLAVAYLHREFAIFALPALVLVEWRHWMPLTPNGVTRAAWSAAGFAVIWLIVDDVKMHLAGGTLALQMASLRGQICLDRAGLIRHVRALLTEALPALYGARPMPLSAFRMNSPVATGWPIVGWIVLGALVVMLVRIVVARGRAAPHSCADGSFHSDSKFGLYLACVGAFTACAYPLSCNTGPGALPLFRYLLLALLLPIGIAADFFQRERSALLRRVVASVIVLWAAANLFDNVRVVRAAVADPPGSEHRVLVDHLLDQRIRYARAIYWDAYVVDFLSRERVITASVDLIRIPEYQKEVDEHAAAAVMLERLPCKGRERVASWCIQRP